MSDSGNNASSLKGKDKEVETQVHDPNVHSRPNEGTNEPGSDEVASTTADTAGSNVPVDEAQGAMQETEEVEAANEQEISGDSGFDDIEETGESALNYRKSSDIQEDKARVRKEPRMRRR
ncbi:hypothetical protein E8E13_010057 [Curvularia kusanoi]|uniref:Uncharacterized protein n=1 Tax=Curvularia kusanoi TaxID=90978 RepID=A0A9P4TJA0_CURKU|nr:hypothetical protein E8E13_010057 [Curvularia kusanoi]